MTELQLDMVKIIVDKVLLAAVAMGFGFYLSRRLELLRTKKAYELYVWQQRTEGPKGQPVHFNILKPAIA